MFFVKNLLYLPIVYTMSLKFLAFEIVHKWNIAHLFILVKLVL